MKRAIGITGGVGAGKSRILDILKENYGAFVLETDLLARRLMEPGEAGYMAVEPMIRQAGRDCFLADGRIDRAGFSQRMFQDPILLSRVNGVIHPMVWQQVEREIQGAKAPIVAVEAALMTKDQSDIFNEMWYVYTSRENRIRRLMENRGYSFLKAERIMANQAGDQEYRSFCDRVIDNNQGPEEIISQLNIILKEPSLCSQKGSIS